MKWVKKQNKIFCMRLQLSNVNNLHYHRVNKPFYFDCAIRCSVKNIVKLYICQLKRCLHFSINFLSFFQWPRKVPGDNMQLFRMWLFIGLTLLICLQFEWRQLPILYTDYAREMSIRSIFWYLRIGCSTSGLFIFLFKVYVDQNFPLK